MQHDPSQGRVDDIRMAGVEDPDNTQEVHISEETLEETVFRNELLLDHILSFTIYDKDALDMKTIKNCKLVNRQWLERVTAMAYKKDDRFPVELNILENPEEAKDFLVTFKDLPPKRIPPFSLKIASPDPDAERITYTLTKEMQYLSVECIQHCGARLNYLEMDCFPDMWNLLESPCHLDNGTVQLPNLEDISITEHFDYNQRNDRGQRSKDFIQWILSGAMHLRRFSLDYRLSCHEVEGRPVDVEIQNLILPKTLTDVNLFSSEGQSPRFWEHLLLNNALPNLTSLLLNGPVKHHKVLYYRILDRFRRQLKTLEVQEIERHEIALPEMPVLEEFSCSRSNWDCDNGLQSFPALKRIALGFSEYDVICNWLQSGTCKAVESVSLVFNFDDELDEPLPDEEEQLLMMTDLKQAFPKVTQLALRLPPMDLHLMKYIFKEMTQLQELYIELVPFHSKYGLTPDAINAAFLGVPAEEVRSLEEQRENWKNIEDWSHWNSEDWLSIAKMSELKKLSLFTWKNGVDSPDVNVDVIVQFALCRMPNFQELSLPKAGRGNKFDMSCDMAQRWLMVYGRKLEWNYELHDGIWRSTWYTE